MKIEELIEKYSFMDNNFTDKVYLSNLVNDLKKIREQQEVEIPQFIADFITKQKKLGHTLSYSIDACMSDGVAEWYWDNSEIFVRAWLDGFEVEKEKKYKVKFKNIQSGTRYLKYDGVIEKWYFGINQDSSAARLCHTKEELKKAGFQEVFNSPLFEVEEVEE